MTVLRSSLRAFSRSPLAGKVNLCKTSTRSLSTNSSFVHISDHVQEALQSKKPIVALETTIYTHGFPYPENIALASHLESIVRTNGAVPATIGILDGVAHIGMGVEEILKLLERAGQQDTIKVSRRDLGYICGLGLAGRKLNGGTTVAGTMVLAHLAGIKVFATGGLGGVHRGAESSMDISADLTELGRTPVAVISSGCKSFLDIPRTLEYLETEGVGVATFADGRPEKEVDFPAFWSRDSGFKSPAVVRTEEEAAAIIHAQSSLGISSGLLFANPIPTEFSIPKSEMDVIITQALNEADQKGIIGKDNTPFILSKIKELSSGKSIPANRALIEANVRRGTAVALALAKLEERAEAGQRVRSTQQFFPAVPKTDLPTSVSSPSSSEPARPSQQPPQSTRDTPAADVIVAGSLAVDLSCDFAPLQGTGSADFSPKLHTSNPSVISQSLGGVGHNIASAAHAVGASVRLCSLVGDDLSGRAVLDNLSKRGLGTESIKVLGPESGRRTAQYVAVNDAKKDLVLAMADMSILENLGAIPTSSEGITSPGSVKSLWNSLDLAALQAKWLVADANWDPLTLSEWINKGKSAGARVAFEPVSVAKSARLFAKLSTSSSSSSSASKPLGVFPNQSVDLATPNNFELAAMHSAARDSEQILERQDWWEVIDAMGFSDSGSRPQLVSATSSALVDQGVPQQAIQLLPFIPCILTKLGAQGVLLTQLLSAGDPRLTDPESAPFVISRSSSSSSAEQTSPASRTTHLGGVYMRLFPPAEIVPDTEVVSVNGVGDTFLGVLIAGLAARATPRSVPSGLTPDIHLSMETERLVDLAQRASVLTLKSKEAVSPAIVDLKGEISLQGQDNEQLFSVL
ncbi:hypothetical protein L228DRAFT_221199 [Xylona heveae TC161]|uniref:Carbohydrate kinase PfkB domain-containing protein n=1 Tax=Xylona heveae (strain CBS 132557 / TC161) TaxID=1328760 RepID=A0A165GLK6_XYLHT|nr:hypothetical protein L228DRAFT_221199 [Xylona heveae TC161]KZF22340.1 hypothetical protein L228DRAFT_221199 [Xylona heveae TC161]